MTDRTPEPQTADLVKRLRNGFDNIPTVLEWEAADAIEELAGALQLALQGFEAFRETAEGKDDLWMPTVLSIQSMRAILSKYGASNG